MEVRLAGYLRQVLGCVPGSRQWRIQTDNEGVEQMRRWDMVQTHSKGAYEQAKHMIKLELPLLAP